MIRGKRKKIMFGWIGRDLRASDILYLEKNYGGLFVALKDLLHARGKKSEWCEGSWPPRRVQVTVEELD
jgi:hypothetical protein